MQTILSQICTDLFIQCLLYTYSDLKCARVKCDFLTNIEILHSVKLFIIGWR